MSESPIICGIFITNIAYRAIFSVVTSLYLALISVGFLFPVAKN